MSRQQGVVMGVTADPLRRALLKSGIPYEWVETPSKRQMELIVAGRGQDCGLGWFRTPEREAVAQFSAPLYQDRPTILLTRTDVESLFDGMSIRDILRQPLRLLRRDGYSYGSDLDRQIAEFSPPGYRVTVGNVQMMQMIVRGRADYLFIAPEEAAYLLDGGVIPHHQLKVLRVSDMPAGNIRYLMCSLAVDPRVIQRLNQALSDTDAG